MPIPFLSFVYLLFSLQTFVANDQIPQSRFTKELVRDFGAIPNDGQNDAAAFRRAMDYCRSHPGTTLLIPAGDYHFSDTLALSFEYKAINGQYGEDVQGYFFRPHAPYVTALNMEGFRDITISAEGASLIQEGWYEAIGIKNAQNVKITGLTLMHKRAPFTSAQIIAKNEGYMDARIDTVQYPYITNEVTGRVHFYNPASQRVYMAGGIQRKELLADGQTIRFHTSRPQEVGDWVILRHSAHNRAGILIKESKNITLENVTLHSQPGMGIVGHRSENITLDHLQVIPLPGTFTSTNTDATHFTSCKGYIRFLNCVFGGQGDDCTNVHNYYWSAYPEQDSKQVRIAVEGADLHALSLDYPDKGDTLLLIDRTNLNPIATFLTKAVYTSEKDWKVVVTVDQDLPKNLDQYYLINKTRKPSVQIYNNTVRSHLARAFLIKTSNVHIKGNVIQQSSGSAIQLGAEAAWREGSPVENILIENNWFVDCGYGHGAQQGTVISAEVNGIRAATSTINRNIVIRNNVMQALGKTAIYIADTEGVQIYRNRIVGADKAVEVKNATQVFIEE
jgi:polygalacturonase